MGAYRALRNLAIFLFMINLGATLAAAMFPSFAMAMNGNAQTFMDNMESQVNSITPQQTGTVGDYITAFGLAVTFFKNLITGNYYVWKALGLDQSVVITNTGVHVSQGGAVTFAKILATVGILVYTLGMIEFVRGVG